MKGKDYDVMKKMAKSKTEAKLIVTVKTKGRGDKIHTVAVHDNRTGKDWTPEQIEGRGICDFLDLNDLKESLDWNVNGDPGKYCFNWLFAGRTGSTGAALVFD